MTGSNLAVSILDSQVSVSIRKNQDLASGPAGSSKYCFKESVKSKGAISPLKRDCLPDFRLGTFEHRRDEFLDRRRSVDGSFQFS